jgi:hypothetical protein
MFSVVNIMQHFLHPGLFALWEFVERIGCFVYPASLLFGRRVNFRQCRPETKGTVPDCKFWSCCQTLPFKLQKQAFPKRRAFTHPRVDRNQFFDSVTRSAHDDKNTGAFAVFTKTRIEMDAVSPNVNIPLR